MEMTYALIGEALLTTIFVEISLLKNYAGTTGHQAADVIAMITARLISGMNTTEADSAVLPRSM